MRPPLPRLLALSAISVVLVGCDGDGRPPARDAAQEAGTIGGTLVIATPAEADILIPPLVNSMEGKKVADMIFEPLAEIGPSLNTVGDEGFQPRIAERWTWAADSQSIAFHLNPRARWHDGRPVRAADVQFTHALYANPVVASPMAPNIADIDSVSVRDSLTAVFWFKRRFPEQFFSAVYHTHVLPKHLLGATPPAALKSAAFARQPVGSGRFRFSRWTPSERMELVADTAHYRGRAKLDRVVFSIAPDFTAATTKLFAGEADFFEVLRPEQLPELARSASLKAVPYTGLQVGYMLFNTRDAKANARPHAVLGDVAVRRALTMALDREMMVRSVLDSFGRVPLGPFLRTTGGEGSGVPQLAYDPARAAALLDSAGWRDGDGDGLREKAGRPLTFTLLVPTSSRSRVRYSVLIQDQLKKAGVAVKIEELEFNTFGERLMRRTFDAAIDLRNLDPSPTVIKQSWSGQAARAKESSNYGSYANARFDVAIDSASVAADPAKSRAFLRQAYAAINEDAPAVWLYEPRMVAGAHKRLQITGMRADAWWAGIADWTVKPGQRIPRDRIGLPAAGRDSSVRLATGSR